MYVYVLQCTKTLQHDCNVYNRFVQGILYSTVHATYTAIILIVLQLVHLIPSHEPATIII